jgi:AsmA family
VPRHCAATGPISNIVSGTVPNCLFQFELTADQLSSGDLVEWFAPQSDKRPWYRTLNSNSRSNSSPNPPGLSTFLAIQAHGALHTGRFNWKNFSASGVATQVDIDRGKVTLTALRAQLLQGTHQGNWTIDLSSHDATSQRVRYHGSGNLQDISLTQLGTLMHEDWITGVADGKFDVEGSGGSFRDLLARSDGHLKFVMRNGSLPHIEIPGSPSPLPVHRFSGDLHLKIGPAWDLSAGRLESQDSIYQVRGTASPASGVNFKLTGSEQAWALTGTLAKPHIATVDRTEGERIEVNAKTVKP